MRRCSLRLSGRRVPRLRQVSWSEAHGWRCAGLRLGAVQSVLEGLLAAVGVPVAFLTPPQWKRLVGMAGQEWCEGRGASAAVRRWPSKAALFALKNLDGRAGAGMPDRSHRVHAAGPAKGGWKRLQCPTG